MNYELLWKRGLAGLLTCALMGCDDGAPANGAPQQQMTPIPVGVLPLQQRDVKLKSTWFGHLRGVEQADIRPEVSGKLIKQVYWDGSVCQKGEVLFEIDPAIYRAAVNQAQASLAAAKASVLQARAADDRSAQDLQRYAKLVKNGSVAEKEYTDAQQTKKSTEAALAAAAAQVSLAEAALESAKINLERCTIRAPFTGLASKSTVSTGDLISVGRAEPLTKMSSVDPIRVDFAVPGKDMLGKILSKGYDAKTGKATDIPEFEIILEDGSVHPSPGHVVAISSEVDSSTGAVNFIGHIPNADLKLRTGSAVRVRATTGTLHNALLVPERAITSSMNHRFIYVVGKDNQPYCIDIQEGESLIEDAPNADGKMTPMLMRVVTGTVKPIEESLRELGFTNPTEANVIVQGTQMADIYAKANANMRKAGVPSGYGTVIPRPFDYKAPTTTTPSVTAQQR